MKKTIFILCAIMLLSGCNAKKPEVDGVATQKTVLSWSPGPISFKNALISGFSKDTFSGNIEVVEVVSAADLFAISDPSDLALYAKDGLICDLGPISRRNRVDLNDFWPAFRSLMQYKGKIYAFPVVSSPAVLFYNKKLFDEAKLPYPDQEWTWSDLLKAARKLTKKESDGFFSKIGFLNQDPEIFIWQNGGWFFSQDAKTCTLNSPEAKAGFKWYYDLIFKYAVMPSPNMFKNILANYNCANASDLFLKNRIAMMVGYKSDAMVFPKNNNFSWGVCPVPRGRYRVTKLKTIVYAIPSASEKKAEAFKFLLYISGPGQYVAAGRGCAVPVRRSIANGNKFLKNTEFAKCGDAKIYVDEMNYARISEISEFVSEKNFLTIWREETNLCFDGKKSPGECLEAIVKRVNKR